MMGDRADILIVYRYPSGKYDVIDLHTHWMGSSFDLCFKDYMRKAREFVIDQYHLLASPIVVVSYLIFLDGYTKCIELRKQLPFIFPCIPDIYPRLGIRHTDGYGYIIVLPNDMDILGEKIRDSLKEIPYRIIKLKIGYNGFSDEDLEYIRNGELYKVLGKYKIVKDEVFSLPIEK